jgi:hypothetical protein
MGDTRSRAVPGGSGAEGVLAALTVVSLTWERFRAARERLLDSTDPTIEFRYDLLIEDEVVERTTGTADLDRLEWATETVTQASNEEYVWHAVSDSSHTWMQMDAWELPRRGCWLQMGRGEVPLGVMGFVPGTPAYVGLPKLMRPQGYGDSVETLRATLPLDWASTWRVGHSGTRGPMRVGT